jgi:hypothetical protein
MGFIGLFGNLSPELLIWRKSGALGNLMLELPGK